MRCKKGAPWLPSTGDPPLVSLISSRNFLLTRLLSTCLQSTCLLTNVYNQHTYNPHAYHLHAYYQRTSINPLYSMSPCPHCGHALLDEEVMAMWSGQESTVSPTWAKIHRKPSEATPQSSVNGSLRYSDKTTEEGQDSAGVNNETEDFSCPVATISDMRGSDIEAAHRITCPICTQRITPQLHIRCYEISESSPPNNPTSNHPNNPSSSSAMASSLPTTATTQEASLSSEIQTALSQPDDGDADSDNNDVQSTSRLTPPRAATVHDEDSSHLSPDPHSPCSSAATGARTAHRQRSGSTAGQHSNSSSQAAQSPDVTQRFAPSSSTAAGSSSCPSSPPPSLKTFW